MGSKRKVIGLIELSIIEKKMFASNKLNALRKFNEKYLAILQFEMM